MFPVQVTAPLREKGEAEREREGGHNNYYKGEVCD